jgi:phosphoribosylcarboxyaminoimidazole (NCAIR) mutase
MTDAVVILGSISDRDIAKKASGIFDKFGIGYTVTVASAHRTLEWESGRRMERGWLESAGAMGCLLEVLT